MNIEIERLKLVISVIYQLCKETLKFENNRLANAIIDIINIDDVYENFKL